MDRPRLTALAIPGAIHLVRGGQVCQDSIRTWEGVGGYVVAVADGHGHQRYTHSDVGSKLACEVAIDAGRLVLAQLQAAKGDPDEVAAQVEPEFKRFIAYQWNRRVKHHIAMRQRLDEGGPWPATLDGDWDEGVRAYGSTLLVLVVSDRWVLWFQLGDGACLHVEKARTRWVFPVAAKKERQATYSLAMKGCIEHMQLQLLSRADRPLRLGVLSTDGLVDQYRDPVRFEEDWGSGLLHHIERRGWVPIIRDLPRRVGLMARTGDDCALGLAWVPEFGEE